MANVATHILVPMFLAEICRRNFVKKPFSRWYVFAAGLLGAIPDFDLFYTKYMTGSFNMMYHREITHSLLVSGLMVIAGLALYLAYSHKLIKYEGWQVCYMLLFAGSLGFACHTLLDAIDGMTRWFYPLSWTIELPNLIHDKFRAGMLDGALLLLWLLYDEVLLKDILCFLRLKK
ncbi:metal-dependent hydrolase [Candidatus Woesearchaeota archaeon]|nr:metal-dependent hydrolase [Candidatus Woesearchaeota archaeon]